MNNVKVTIMIPTYNQEKYVFKAVESALAQTYEDLEVVVSDDCSPDNTKDILKKFFGNTKFKYYRNIKNIGRVANYRKGLYEYATGDWVVNLDGDDYFIDNEYIKNAMKLIKSNDSLVLVMARHLTYVEDRDKFIDNIKIRDKSIMDGKLAFLSILKRDLQISHLSALYKRTIAIDKGFYTEDIIASDTESILNLIVDSKVGLLNDLVGVWRVHEANESKKVNYDQFTKNYIYITKQYEIAKNRKIFKEKKLYFCFIKALKIKLYEDLKLYIDLKRYKDMMRHIIFVSKISKFATFCTIVNPKLYIRLIVNVFYQMY